jgi:hypothetical protein
MDEFDGSIGCVASRAKRGRVVSMDVTTSHTRQIPTVTQPCVRTGAHGMPNNLMPFERNMEGVQDVCTHRVERLFRRTQRLQGLLERRRG